MKRIVLLLSLLLSAVTGVSAEREVTVTLNGEAMEFDVPPAIIAERAMVPMRAIFEGLGANVEWLAADQIIIAVKDGLFVSLKIGSDTMIVQDLAEDGGRERILLDSPPVMIDGRTLVPVRAVSESLGAAVAWDAETGVVRIDAPEEAEKTEPEQDGNAHNNENGGQE